MPEMFPKHELDDLLSRAAAASPECDPQVGQRILARVLTEWDSSRPDEPPLKVRQTGKDFNRRRWVFRLMPAGIAALVAVGVLINFFWPSKDRMAQAGWHSTEGQTRSQLRSIFPQFAAFQAAPETLPSGSAADSVVEQIPTPSFDGFEIRSESKFYDMTWWRRVEPGQIQSGRISPVVYTRVLELRRIQGSVDNRVLRFKFWTGGYAVDPVKIKPTDTIVVGRLLEPLHKNGKPMLTYLLTTDVSNHPEGEFFTVVVHAVFWNGFNDEVRENATTAVASGTLINADIGVLLPPEHSVVSGWALYKIAAGPGEERMAENRLKAGRPPRDEAGILYWPIARVEAGYKYMMEWEWAKEGEKK